jgi:EpsI family protein
MSFLWRNVLLFALMLTAAGLTQALHPTQQVADQRAPMDLASIIPGTLASWREDTQSAAQIVDPQQLELIDVTYSQTLTRSYVDANGYRIMLSIAYGKTQRGNLQLHHPELCYPAQGFAVNSNRTGELATPYGAIPVRRLETQLNRDRSEPVTYWAMIGDQVALGSFDRKLVEMRHGLRGNILDGLLFRVSSVDNNSEAAFALQASFVADLLGALSPADRQRIAGI